MRHSRLRPALVGLAASTLLMTGCSTEPGPAETSNPPPTAVVGQDQPDRWVEILRVVSGDTAVVSPIDESDPLFGTEITVSVPYVQAPEPDQCGGQAAIDVATDHFGEGVDFHLNYPDEGIEHVDADGVHTAIFETRSISDLRMALVSTGTGWAEADAPNYLAMESAQSQRSNKGSWAACPDFGQ